MARIQQLSRQMVDKIAAGEVIERPASVVKELVENAIDAKARRVEVTVDGGGLRVIRVTDDGEGVVRDDLPLAVVSHATSKIATPDDLFTIGSLGFRGEALASIAAVSHFLVRSRPRGETGAELKVDGGDVGEVCSVGMPPGTTVEAADLFFSVPARRAFLRSERGELRAAIDEVKRQALARPEVGFRVVADGKTVLDAPATDEPRERIAQLLGRALSEDLLVVPRAESEGVRLRGYTTPCDRSRGDSRQQYFFLNGRCVRDVTLLTAVKQAYANLIPPRRHPSLLLWLDLDPVDVDVNVHPQKSEVRFRKDRAVFKLVRDGLRAALRAGGLVTELTLPRRAPGALEVAARPAAAAPASLGTVTLPFPSGAPGTVPAPAELGPSGGGSRFLQVHRRYVLVEDAGGVLLLDPHAMHERILYEQILERLEREPLESQRFLFPQLVEVPPEELVALEERSAELASLGFEATAFGPGQVAVHAAPRMLRAERVAEAVRRLLAEDLAERDPGEAGSGLLHDLAASLACRSAVRFGDALPEAEIAALLAQRPGVPRGHCCPHGRPTAVSLRLDELDRRFGRQGAPAAVDAPPRLL
jgi:DNA mismatch repair protein MutL